MSHRNRNDRNSSIVQTQSAEMRVQAMMRSFSGPLPPPEVLERYNQFLPGTAERIIAMAEGQHNHRIELERHVITSNVSAQKLGTILGFIVAMTVVIGGHIPSSRGKKRIGVGRNSYGARLAGGGVPLFEARTTERLGPEGRCSR